MVETVRDCDRRCSNFCRADAKIEGYWIGTFCFRPWRKLAPPKCWTRCASMPARSAYMNNALASRSSELLVCCRIRNPRRGGPTHPAEASKISLICRDQARFRLILQRLRRPLAIGRHSSDALARHEDLMPDAGSEVDMSAHRSDDRTLGRFKVGIDHNACGICASPYYFLPFFFLPDACVSALVDSHMPGLALLGVLAPLPGVDLVFGVENSSTAARVGVPFALEDADVTSALVAACSEGTTAAALGADVPGAPTGACVGFIVICCGAGSPSNFLLLIIRFSAMSRRVDARIDHDLPSRSLTRGMFRIVSRVFSACAISVAVWKIIPPHPCLNVFASDTTSTISASSSFSAAAKRAIVSSPTSPRPCRFVSAILSSRIRQIRLTSAVARTSRADLSIESGTC